MTPYRDRIRASLRDVEGELARQVEARPRGWHFRVERAGGWFGDGVRAAHRRLRQWIPAYIRDGQVMSLLTAPLIYSLIVPLVLLDAWVSLYQWVCFPIYGIARVQRQPYFVLDRQKLSYLSAIEKAGCTFCSYGSGLLAYVREILSRTEAYWCPIKHARAIPMPHSRYHLFFDYGDAERYRLELMTLRRTLRPPDDAALPVGTLAASPRSRETGVPDRTADGVRQ